MPYPKLSFAFKGKFNKFISEMKYGLILLFIISGSRIPLYAYDKDDLTMFRNSSGISFGLACSIKYEKAIGNHFSIGLRYKYHVARYQPGHRFDLLTRFYPFGVLENFYVQPRFSAGKHQILMYYNNEGGGTTYPLLEKKIEFTETVYGGGLDAGVLIPLNKSKRMFLDLSVGYNFYPFPKNIPLEFTQGYAHYIANDNMPTGGFWFQDSFVGKLRWSEPLTGAGRKWLITFTYGFVI